MLARLDRRGALYRSSDEPGTNAAEGLVGVHDLHAILLHRLDINREPLTYLYANRDFGLTDRLAAGRGVGSA